jgi:hypothetical protein
VQYLLFPTTSFNAILTDIDDIGDIDQLLPLGPLGCSRRTRGAINGHNCGIQIGLFKLSDWLRSECSLEQGDETKIGGRETCKLPSLRIPHELDSLDMIGIDHNTPIANNRIAYV